MTKRRFTVYERGFGKKRNPPIPHMLWFVGCLLIAMAMMIGKSMDTAAAAEPKSFCSDAGSQLKNPDAVFMHCMYPE
jgi:hypothetical protein